MPDGCAAPWPRGRALKFLPGEFFRDPQALRRLREEARAAAALNHPHVCTIHEIGEAEGRTFIAMEWIEGCPLGRMVPSEGLPPETVLRLGMEIAEALAHAHSRGIVHRT